MASIYLGVTRGYSAVSDYGAFDTYFEYDSVARVEINTVRFTNARIRCTDTGVAGFTENTIYLAYVGAVYNSAYTNTNITGNFSGQAHENSTWTSAPQTFDMVNIPWDATTIIISYEYYHTGMGSNRRYLSANATIPQGAVASVPTVSAADVTIGSAFTIYTNRMDASLTHTIRASFGGINEQIATGVEESYTWTPPLSLQYRITNDVLGTCTITCYTYSGGTHIGTNTVSLTLWHNWESCHPTLTGSYTSLTTAINNITGSATLLISGLCDVQFTATPTLKYGATVSSITIGSTNVASAGSPYHRTINDMTASTVVMDVIDSRGYSASYTVTLSYAAYSYITFMASFFRTAAMNNEVALNFSGTFYNNTIGTTTNTLTVRYRYKAELGEWGAWVSITAPTLAITGNAYKNLNDVPIIVTGTFDHTKQYLFEIEFKDSIDTKTNTILVRPGRHILKITEFVQVLQGKLHIQKLFTKNDKDFVFDFVYDVITRSWVVHVYGLTQMFEPQHVFQADVNTRSIITVLNETGYPLLKYTIDEADDNYIDYKNIDTPADYNNVTMIDTGISPLENILEKRARELQFTTYTTSRSPVEFFVNVYIDSINVSNPDETTIDWISDPDDPNFGQLYEIEEEIANVYGETNLDSWLIDYSTFQKIGLVKSHLRLHGKGLYYRATIVNRSLIVHELSGITWVYRIMNAR